ncbi:MAG: rsbT co-antagonist protein RsbR [Chloroflexota bacterium]|nr:rsbT co-antagonist protein RsbR [Chloroflexota bacterium]
MASLHEPNGAPYSAKAGGVPDGVGASTGRSAMAGALVREMAIGEEEIAKRKEFLELGADDILRLQELNPLALKYADEVIEEFYNHLLKFEEGQAFFADPETLEYVKQMQRSYFLRLTGGDYGLSYVEDRLRIGEVHERIELPMKLYLGMYNFYLRAVAARIFKADRSDSVQALDRFLSLMKLTFLDIGLATDTYILRRERTIREQEKAIRELPTPVLQVRDGLLILPIIGVIDAQRARQLTEQLLRSIRDNRAKVVVMDVTGVASIDSATANRLVQTVDASRLMGATVIVTGLSPEIAQTLVTIGVDLSEMRTVGDLQGGIEEADRLLGYRAVRIEDWTPHDPRD